MYARWRAQVAKHRMPPPHGRCDGIMVPVEETIGLSLAGILTVWLVAQCIRICLRRLDLSPSGKTNLIVWTPAARRERHMRNVGHRMGGTIGVFKLGLAFARLLPLAGVLL